MALAFQQANVLFIGVAMVSTVSSLHGLLVSIHKPLGVMILPSICKRPCI